MFSNPIEIEACKFDRRKNSQFIGEVNPLANAQEYDST